MKVEEFTMKTAATAPSATPLKPAFNLADPTVRADPYPFYSELRRHYPVHPVDPGGMWAVSRYEDVMFVLKNHKLFSSTGFEAQLHPEWLGMDNPQVRSILVQDPPLQTQLRGLISLAFTPRAVARMEGRVQAFARKLVDEVYEQGEGDFVSLFSVPLPACVIADMLGLDPSLHTYFKRWGSALTSIHPSTPVERRDFIRQSILEMQAYLQESIDARRRQPRDDMVSDLLAARIDGQALSNDDILAFLFLLLPAGFETTTNLIANGMVALLKRPAYQEQLRADPSRIPRFLDEVLRYDAPVQGLVRRATTDVMIGDVRVPEGTIIVPLLGSANRDEQRFPNPDEFNPERFGSERNPQNNLAFGHGIHFCVGMTLARMEARIGFELLLSRFSSFELLPGTHIQYSPATLLRAPLKLPVRFIRDA
jgi:cytochrome P450